MENKQTNDAALPNLTEPIDSDLSARQTRRVSMRRAAQFTDQLLVNEGIRRHLLDDQAQRLLSWAIGRIESMAEESAEIDDAAAERLLTTLSKGVTHVIWQIDRLMGGTIEDEPIADELKAIAANSAEGGDDALFDSLYAFATQQHDTIQSGNNTSE